MKQRYLFVIVAVVVAAFGTAWQLSGPKPEPAPEDPAPNQKSSAAPSVALPRAQATPALSDELPPESAFGTRDLFADYQAALGATELSVIEKGIAAYDACAGYVYGGDLESWLNSVMPKGLAATERDRRATYARRQSRKCAGFAQQGAALAEIERLRDQAYQLGGLRESLRRSYSHSSEALADIKETRKRLSCEALQRFPEAHGAYGFAFVTAGRAALANRNHLLNSYSQPARDIGVNLALCDLEPERCSLARDAGNFIGSACMQQGKCTYRNEVDFWQAESSPEVFAAADRLRRQLTEAVRSKNCPALLE